MKEVQARGVLVAMTGDGVNDALALAQADLGIAVGAGSDVAVDTADVILVRSNLLDVVAILALSRATYRKMIQNLIWATGYDVVALPLAAGEQNESPLRYSDVRRAFPSQRNSNDNFTCAAASPVRHETGTNPCDPGGQLDDQPLRRRWTTPRMAAVREGAPLGVHRGAPPMAATDDRLVARGLIGPTATPCSAHSKGKRSP